MAGRNRIAGMTLSEIIVFLHDQKSNLPYGYKLPYMQWYEENFIGSSGVREMPYQAEWMYRQLLAKAWVSKNAPYLPNDPETLRKLSGCQDKKLWSKHSKSVLGMFEKTENEEELFHSRQLVDYAVQIAKVISNIKNGSEGGKSLKNKDEPQATAKQPPPDCQANATLSLSQLELELELEPEKELKSEVESNQGDETDMRADKQIALICEQVFKKKAYLRGRSLERIKELEILHKGTAVVRAFGDWCLQHADDYESPRDPVAAFLADADDILNDEAPFQKAQKSSDILDLLYDMSKVNAQIMFGDREKTRLYESLKEYTRTEILSSFRTWVETQDFSIPKVLQYAGKNFSEVADQLAYSIRRHKKEAEEEKTARDARVRELQEAANAESQEAERKRKEEEAQFNPIADLMS
jgi:hypothetical protein